MSHYTQKLSVGEKIGYSMGDGGANLVFQLLMAFQFMFFTQIMGLSADAAGILFLIGRAFDAFTDPMMGIIADRTKSKWGRFRPWLVWSALPFAGIFWMAFTSPGWEPTAQAIYAYVAYFALMAIYTVNNVPYCALNGVMTGDVEERTSISTYRFVAATIAGFIIQGLTLPLVDKFGQGDDAKGWSITVGIFACISIFLFIITFFSVKERVEPDPDQQSTPLQDIKDTFKNKPWVILFCATLLIFMMLVVRGGSLALYMRTYVDLDAVYIFLGKVNLTVPESGDFAWWQKILNVFNLLVKADGSNTDDAAYGFFNMAGTPMTLIGVLLSKPLSRLFGKRNVFITCLFLTAASTVWLFLIPADDINQMFIQGLSWGLCYGPTIPLLWSMIGDTADYSEWMTGRRATGFVFAGVVFALKFGLGVGGFVQGFILARYGYGDGNSLDDMGILGIRHCATIYPAMFIVGAALILFLYPITKKLNYQIGDELAERRRKRNKENAAASKA